MKNIEDIADLDTGDFVDSIWSKVYNTHSISSSPAVRHPDITPNYEIVPALRNPKIEPGDTIEIDIFVSGYGLPKFTRLNVFGSVEYIFRRSDDSVRVVPNISGIVDSNEVESLIRGPPARGLGLVEERSFNGLPISTPLPPEYFVEDPGLPGEQRTYAEHMYPNIVGESFVGDGASLRVEIDTKKEKWYSSAWYSGKYPIHLVFLYGDDEEVKISKEELSLEVKSRGDKFWWLTAIIAVTAALTFITQFLIIPVLDIII